MPFDNAQHDELQRFGNSKTSAVLVSDKIHLIKVYFFSRRTDKKIGDVLETPVFWCGVVFVVFVEQCFVEIECVTRLDIVWGATTDCSLQLKFRFSGYSGYIGKGETKKQQQHSVCSIYAGSCSGDVLSWLNPHHIRLVCNLVRGMSQAQLK